jgi:5'-methylthioadenosine phosphorylase
VSAAAAEVAVFGGSGFYAFLDDVDEIDVTTPFGAPSARIALGAVGGRRVAFLPRHGPAHELAPHRINYRANLWALHELGVTRILGPCAAGSLRPDVHPGDFVVCDQLVDRTRGRADTFYDDIVHHVSYADPYCAELGAVTVATARASGITVHERGTVVVVPGPRFSTRAESRWYRAQGWDVVNMTQYPEAYLARELGMCYSGIALITDYDTGLEGSADEGGAGVEPVTMDEVFAFLERNAARVRDMLFDLIPAIPATRSCGCGSARGPLPTPAPAQ